MGSECGHGKIHGRCLLQGVRLLGGIWRTLSGQCHRLPFREPAFPLSAGGPALVRRLGPASVGSQCREAPGKTLL